MQLQNSKRGGNIFTQYQQFKKQILQSGQDPRKILSNLISSGKVSNEQLNNVINQAKQLGYLDK